jgi:hypothetical protein
MFGGPCGVASCAEPAIVIIADIGRHLRHVRQNPAPQPHLQDVRQPTVQQHTIQHRSLIICAFFSKSKTPA